MVFSNQWHTPSCVLKKKKKEKSSVFSLVTADFWAVPKHHEQGSRLYGDFNWLDQTIRGPVYAKMWHSLMGWIICAVKWVVLDFEGWVKLRHAGYVIGRHYTGVSSGADLLPIGMISMVPWGASRAGRNLPSSHLLPWAWKRNMQFC